MENWLSSSLIARLLSHTFWLHLLLVLGATLALYAILRGAIGFASRRITHPDRARRSTASALFGEILRSTRRVILLLLSLMIALNLVTLPDRWQTIVAHGWFIVLMLQLALWADAAVRIWLTRLLNATHSPRNPVTTVILGLMLRLVIWVMVALAILSNMGVNITALVASLGVGGIAIALAIQTVLSDVFASLAIGFDKPFEQGDFIVFGDVSGTIEHIGLKTTRLRSLSGEQVICSNTLLLQQTIHNYKRMAERRILFRFGIAYATPPEAVRKVSGMIKEIITRQPDARFDRAHFFAFEENQLTFEVVWFVTVADYTRYMDIQQEINLQLMAELQAHDIRFAFPTRQVTFTGGTFPPLSVVGGDSGELPNAQPPRTAQAWRQ
ncbi:mechanosensitive ion channel family protein [Pantoea sp. 1.19]|uniref:mechanosensitive ion channel family protein n=1 Tax=Pantoea sp. 1.19 TaxID=1925589 RepID=UPI0009490CA8|nr:mechanosensitive ion channel family protein [Pantoea sp. 1.19]